MKTSLVLLGISLAAALGTARGQVVVYDFNSNDSASLVNPNVTASAFSAGGGVNNSLVGLGIIAGTGFAQRVDAAAANTAGDYFTFTLTANSGFKINATLISFEISSSESPGGNRRGPNNTGIFMSVNGGAFSAVTLSPDALVPRQPATDPFATKTATLSVSEVDSISLRFVGFGTGNPTTQDQGTMRIDNVSMAGSVVPEPEQVAVLAGLGLLGFGAWRRWSIRAA